MSNSAKLLFLAIISLLPFLASFESLEEDQGDPYYGVPLGAMHYSAEGTSAEVLNKFLKKFINLSKVYAADEFSIIFNHFNHNPRENGFVDCLKIESF